MSNRGQTWSKEEVQSLLEIWADEHIRAQLSSTHKNAAIFGIFSKLMSSRGFQRSVVQCRIKTKKLRQQYIKVRDTLRQTGSTSRERERFEWYDDLDKILGIKPEVEAVDIMESVESAREAAPDVDHEAETSRPSAPLDEEEVDTSQDSDVSSAQGSEACPPCGRLELPRAKARKRRASTRGWDEDDFAKYIAASNKVLEEMKEAETRQLETVLARQERMMTAQQEANDRRFSALMSQMQSQQQASNQLIANLFSQLLQKDAPASSSSWSGVPAPPLPQSTPRQLPPSGTPPHQNPNPQHDNL